MAYIRGEGRVPCDVALVGEYPGWREAKAGRPWVGDAGEELHRFVGRDVLYLTNLKKRYEVGSDGKPFPPTEEETATVWGPILDKELAKVDPRLVITAGLHPTRYLLGPWATMEFTHGKLFKTPRFDVLPVYNPAAALNQPDRYQGPMVRDFEAVREAMRGRLPYHPRFRESRSGESYLDMKTIHWDNQPIWIGRTLAIDSEGERLQHPACFTVTADGVTSYLIRTNDAKSMSWFKGVVESAETCIFHAAMVELRSLDACGIRVGHFVDTMEYAYLLGESQGLKTLAFRIRGRRLIDYEDLVTPLDVARVKDTLGLALAMNGGIWRTKKETARVPSSIARIVTKPGKESMRVRWGKSKFAPLVPLPPPPTWIDVPADEGVPYACKDAIETHHAHAALAPLIRASRLTRIAQIDTAIFPMLNRMAVVGQQVHGPALLKLAKRFERGMAMCEQQIEDLTGRRINPLSPKQVSDLLFRELRLPPTRLTPSGNDYSTEDKYLEAMRESHPVLAPIIRARLLNKMKGTYAEKLPTLLTHGRYHMDPRPTVAKTGRLTEAVILLIPKHTKEGKWIRSAFVAGEGRVLVSIDLSQIELRVGAHLSGDKVLLANYREGKDLHAGTAEKFFGVPPEKQDKSLHRLPAKTINFLVLMGGTHIGLRDQLHEQGLTHWTEDACEDLHSGWFDIHHGFKEWTLKQIAFGRAHGYVTTMFGRRINVAGVKSKHPRIRAGAERECYATVIQGTAAEIAKRWMAKMWKEVRGLTSRYLEPWAWIHDDVTWECDPRDAKPLAQACLDLIPQDLDIPTTGEAEVGTDWGHLDKLV